MKMPPNGRVYFAKLARMAGKSPEAFAKANIHTQSLVGELARKYYLDQGVHGSGDSNMSGAGDKRSLGQKLYQVG